MTLILGVVLATAVTSILGVVLPTVVTVRAAMLGLTRGATVGLMVGMRDPMLMLGERMKFCA